jgi:hypothetical protein
LAPLNIEGQRQRTSPSLDDFALASGWSRTPVYIDSNFVISLLLSRGQVSCCIQRPRPRRGAHMITFANHMHVL